MCCLSVILKRPGFNFELIPGTPTVLFCFVPLFNVYLNMAEEAENNVDRVEGENPKPEKMFTLKKWNAVAMWSWDVACDTCAICRVQVMGKLHLNIFKVMSRLYFTLYEFK